MKKILLVDDESIIRKLARRTIEGADYVILEASSGANAVEIARRENPHLILLDVLMPGMDGFEVCRILKSDPLTQGIIIIMITGSINPEIRAQGKSAGADDFFEKPFSPVELLDKIRIFLDSEQEPLHTDGERSPQPAGDGHDLHTSRTTEELTRLEHEQLLLYASDLGRIYNEEVKKSKELKMAYQRLKEMENMKDAFISLVSHELRTPLSIIKGYISLILQVMKNRETSSDLHQSILAIAESSNKLENLIQELLDFSKMKTGLISFEKKEIFLPGMLQLIVNDFKSEAEKKEIDISLDVESEFRPIRADQSRLKDAFSHIISNALTFTPRGGKVWIETIDEGAWVKVRVCDTGIGIPAEEQERIFSPFYQSKEFLSREVEGIGLGLTIAKHIIEDHGGSIKVDSVLGKGTKFSVSLPRSFQDAKEIVTELTVRHSQHLDDFSDSLRAAEKQLLLYAQEMSSLYNSERLKTEQLQSNIQELELTYVQTIAALTRAIDIKESHTRGHTGRVSFYANCIAKHHNSVLLDEKEFIYSLLLHDVGNIGIGEEILGKAGKLSNEEWEKIKSHPELGEKILGKIKFLAPALASVRAHHERWDGKGYPDGLKGKEIPLPARIINVADAFDAMTTDRPYRKKLSKEDARTDIIKNSGTQFDPEIVESFLKAWDEIFVYSGTIIEQSVI